MPSVLVLALVPLVADRAQNTVPFQAMAPQVPVLAMVYAVHMGVFGIIMLVEALFFQLNFLLIFKDREDKKPLFISNLGGVYTNV